MERKPKKDESREKFMNAIEKRAKAADDLSKRLDKLMERRRLEANNYEGIERRHA